MSPRAAWRLHALGFSEVFDYAFGKADWTAAGLPIEGALAGRLAGDAVSRDVPTCHVDDDLAHVQATARANTWDTCIVINEQRVVLGRLGRTALRGDAQRSIEEVMTEGPSTIRPSLPLRELIGRMVRTNQQSALVTTAEGQLIGLVHRKDAERQLTTG